ncbi:hypothetical protein RB623_21380 [Mesorhizobium sp. LHD-90]|uniref:hypothetical protein n=1 Tax=Mesorhizobium sp. LHD-90 TaxID=3071414 RepID=UPI0027E0D6F5|nr:hypothetical protein [Mesorhizobium sp. LHD-90]MDQ6436610.1 hypothetical protein [Mesorhizobium sp. LHD-90]
MTESSPDKLIRLFIEGDVDKAQQLLTEAPQEQADETVTGVIEALKKLDMSGKWPNGHKLTEQDRVMVRMMQDLVLDPSRLAVWRDQRRNQP